jgi:DNA polymerase-3 subunit delta
VAAKPVKADKSNVLRALTTPALRFTLLYGPDEANSRAMARLAEGERIEMSGAELRTDPARLADEAAAISLFGGKRHIIVEPAGDEMLAAAQALLEATAAGNSVALVAGALKPTSKLLKLAQESDRAAAFVSYAPEPRDGPKLVQELAQAHGLTVRADVARRIADGAAGNRAVIAQELSKYELFLDASSENPAHLDDNAVSAIGAANEEGDLSRVVDSVSNGDAGRLQAELMRLRTEGIDGIPLIRAVLRRLNLLAPMRAEVEAGRSAESVLAARGKAIFWKEKDAIAGQLSRWPAELIARAQERLIECERQLKSPNALGPVAVDEELFAICRQAARLR